MVADIECPRCALPLGMVHAPTREKHRALALEACDQCGGVWIDGGELSELSGPLAPLADRHDAIIAESEDDRQTAIAACPRCKSVTIEFKLLAVRLDYCVACRGLWLDGDERKGLLDGLVAIEGDASSPPGNDPYRRAAHTIRNNAFECAGCRASIALEQAVPDAAGNLHCRTCMRGAKDQAEAEEIARLRARTWGLPSLPSLEQVGTALAAFASVLVIAAPNHCTHCRHHGCRC